MKNLDLKKIRRKRIAQKFNCEMTRENKAKQVKEGGYERNERTGARTPL
jgi:hypothetical protein